MYMCVCVCVCMCVDNIFNTSGKYELKGGGILTF